MPRSKRLPIVLTEIQKYRFLANVRRTDYCWFWISRVDDFGYGHFKVKGRSLKAHRVAWTLERGPIPDDKTIDHVCRNPRCVNPAHLALVSNKENILRGQSPTAKNARLTHCKRGHLLTPDNVRARDDGKRDCVRCDEVRRPRRRPSVTDTGTPTTRDASSSFISCQREDVSEG